MKNQAIFILLGFLVITACGEKHKKSAEHDESDDPFIFEDFGAPAMATCKNDTDCSPNQLCMVGTCINKINKNEEPDIGTDDPKSECTINYHCNGDEECVDGSCVAKAADDEEDEDDDEESDDDEDDALITHEIESSENMEKIQEMMQAALCQQELNACLVSIPGICADLLTFAMLQDDLKCNQQTLTACSLYQDMNKLYPVTVKEECEEELAKL